MTAVFEPPPEIRPADGTPEAAEAPAPRRRAAIWLERLAAVAFSFLLAAVCLVLFTRHNDFTFRYHPDELSKIRQIQSGGEERNLNHPLLLLEASQWAVQWLGTPNNDQAIVEVGRLVSAALAVGAVVALAWVGYAVAGLVGMVLVGATVGLCPQLLTYAHYMKEDTALIFGIAVTLLGTRMTWDARRWWSRIIAVTVLGMGVGLAASGKYPGAITLALAVPVAVVAPRTWLITRLLAPLWVIAMALVTAMAINFRAINPPAVIIDSLPAVTESGLSWAQRGDATVRAFFRPSIIAAFERELEHSTEGHGGLTMDRPNSFFLGLFGVETMAHVRWLAGVYGVSVLGTLIWKRRRWWDLWMIAFAAGYLVMLSYSVIMFHRYFLPVAVMTYLFGGLGLVALVNLLSETWRWRVAAALVGVTAITAVQGMRCVDYLHQFADDSRYRLRAWLAENVPAGTRVVAENYAGLNGPGDHRDGQRADVTVRVYPFFSAPQAGSIDQLRRRGIEYVIICDIAYARFFAPQSRDVDRERDRGRVERHREWYTELETNHELVWSAEPKHNMNAFTNPVIKVYRLVDSRQ
mgnify:FL=1